MLPAHIETLESRRLFSAPPMGVNIRRLGPDSGDELFADAMKEAGTWFLGTAANSTGAAPVDAGGWPTTDAGVTVINNTSEDGGTYALSFTGQATVAADPIDPAIQIVNPTYDPTSNTTTASVVVPAGANNVTLDFTNTLRLPTDTAPTGITNVQLMRPSAVDSSTPYAAGTLFSTPILNLLANFSAIRFMDYSFTNNNTQVNWSDRTLPSSEQVVPAVGGAWEYAVALCNQTNEDMWINIPEMATDAYITNLAQLIDYGSDGVNPYTGPAGSAISTTNTNPVPTTGPVWAGLNPNLHVYVEYSNEVWNTSFQQNQENQAAAIAEVNAGGSPLNFDGDPSQYDWAFRRTAERIVDTSNIFRGVFGDSQMMTQIRPVFEWQYGNVNSTAAQGLTFINNYYNNGNGVQNVPVAHPVNYFLWGGGGGWYGGLSNPNGTGDVNIPDNNFATPTVTNYQPDPTVGSWTFTGTAGIAANGSSAGNPNSTSGAQAAVIQGTGSFSQTVNFTGGLADLVFDAAGSGTESFTVSIDGSDVTNSWTLGSTFSQQRTAVFDTGSAPGPHTITFTGTGGGGSIYISKIVAETANGMYNSTIQDISWTTQSESNWATAFGLQMDSYEGGFVFGSGWIGTPLQIAANQDIRAEAADIAQMDEFYANGGDLPMYYDTTNHIWALTLDINNQNTPKIQAVQSVLAAPQPAVNYGTVVPSSAGSFATVANSLGKYQGAAGLYPFRVTKPGVYTLTLTGSPTGGQLEHYLLDGQPIGATLLPYLASLTFTIATPGLHALLLTTTGTGSINQSNPAGAITITAGTLAPAQLAFTQLPATQTTAGSAIAPGGISVAVQSASGAVVPGDSSTVTLTLNGGTFSNGLRTATATASNGVATFFGLTISRAGGYTLTASDSTAGVSSVASPTFYILPGPASASTSVLAVSRYSIALGASTTVTLQAKDSYGNNLITGGSAVAFSLGGAGSSSGILSSATDRGNGTYTATFTATTAGSARQIIATLNGNTVTTAAPSIMVPSTPITAKAIVFRANAGHTASATAATFSVPNLSASAANFTASINWGDSNLNYAGTVYQDSPGNFHIVGTHMYANVKSGYAVKVSITESGGLVQTLYASAIVTAAPLIAGTVMPISATHNVTLNGVTIAAFQDNNSLHTLPTTYTGIINWGDGTSSAATFKLYSTTTGVAAYWRVLGSHKYSRAGTFTVKTTVKEPSANLALVLTTPMHVV